MIENHIRKLFPKYKSKRELKERIEIMRLDRMYNQSSVKKQSANIEHIRVKRSCRFGEPDEIIMKFMAYDIGACLKENGYLSFSKEIEIESGTTVYYCDLKIVVPERKKENE